jgi:hypothetical protein
MVREQFINFLESAVVVLALTNAVSVLAASYAISLVRGSARRKGQLAEQPVVVQFPGSRARR